MIKSIRMRLRALFDRAGVEAEMNEELRFHLEQQTKLLISQGYSPEDAVRRARLTFGSVEVAREGHRDNRGTRDFEDTLRDIRHAARSLWRDRALSLAGVATLALGIGSVTAVFSAVNEVMLRELPFKDANRLVQVYEENTDRGWVKNWVAPANLLSWRDRVQAFDGAAGYFDFIGNSTILGEGEPQLVPSTSVTGNFMDVLGIRMALGRGFTDADDWNDGQRPLVISTRLWRSMFKSDTGIIGRTISIAGRPWQVVGVMPEGFIIPSPNVDIWSPMLWNRQQPNGISFRRAHSLRVVARLKPGVSLATANAQLMAVAKQLEAEFPATNTRMYAGMVPLREWIVGDTKKPLVVLLSAAAVLLLIACANVGNLLLVHALGRSRDVALRFALGATRSRVARQALTESLVLSAVGGVLGSALGWAGAKALLAMQPSGLLPVNEISVDVRVLGLSTLLVAVSGVVFGVAPALIATRQAPADSLKAGGRTFTGGQAHAWGRRLVVAEVALAAVLMVGAGLLLRSYQRLSKVDAGFDARGVMTATMSVPTSRYDSAFKVTAFYGSLMDRMRALPGVERVGATAQLPTTGTNWTANIAIQGRAPFEKSADIIYRETLGDYFSAMRVPLVRGRVFDATDNRDSPPVAIINEELAKQYFPNENPVGLSITTLRVPDTNSVWYTIVGVVGSERQATLTQPARAEVYLNANQTVARRMALVLRTRADIDPVSIAPAIRRTVREADSLLAIMSLRPMTDVHADAMSRQRFTSVLILSFAVTGVVLALVGVFGVLAQLVQTRWREMGIRMALGAQQSDVRMMVLRRGGTLLGAGVAIGLLVSLGATRVLTSMLFGVERTDAGTYAVVGLLILAIGLVAASVPAWRASRANPASTLHAE